MNILPQVLNYAVGGLAIAAFLLLGGEIAFPQSAFYPFLRAAGLTIHGLFVLDVVVRFLAARPRLSYFARHWLDPWFLAPFVFFAAGSNSSTMEILCRESAILLMIISRIRRAQSFNTLISARPAQTAIAAFALAIASGAIVLMLPDASATSEPVSWINALFTATSATCVTGLSVVDTATRFSVFGQVVILILIQLGGLGIMTFSVCLAILLRRGFELRQQVALRNVMDYEGLGGLARLIFFIVGMAAFLELVGAAGLTLLWRTRFESLSTAVYHGVFHSISAFCNAGFSTFSDNLTAFRSHPATLLIVGSLIVLGGLGFLEIRDIARFAGKSWQAKAFHGIRLRMQTKVVLSATLFLLLLGAVLLYQTEFCAGHQERSVTDGAISALFQSVTARTAGFNTVNIGALGNAGAFILIVLMFIGASPGSTGGGIKTTTAAVLWATLISTLRQREHVELFRRTLPVELVRKALSALCLGLLTVILFTTALSYTEHAVFLDVLFETVSALGTVGLSRGLTPNLTQEGRILITLLMFIGRLGPLTLAYALTLRPQSSNYQYAEERVMIG